MKIQWQLFQIKSQLLASVKVRSQTSIEVPCSLSSLPALGFQGVLEGLQGRWNYTQKHFICWADFLRQGPQGK